MNDIKLTCPDCGTQSSVSTKKLDETQGVTHCPTCQYEFHLVKKIKKKTTQQTNEIKFREPHINTDNIDVSDVFNKPKSTTSQPKSKQKPLNYRIPKASDFAEVRDEPLAFNLLDRDSVNSQLPQIAVKPAVNANSVSAATNLKQDGQQNNITIHTDSLVFTLLGDGQTTQSPMVAPNSIAALPNAGTPVHSMPPVIAPASEHSNMNWTIATIAALIVLIMQLFYWVLLLT